ncbi:hypothetical protein C1I63_01650 [Rathayibacter caricis DSM 15933]|uniref:Uncharacterized protein n=1 Tax=Rathayibacter caricis DSM 15933 TaxID=1328867 RepID=A0A2T4UQ80_9MICO|nr:hypothetical protein [Rathayibacter caricis]PTL71679.1 hypothetical protein C1I63_01650 [Rathayibacter caricis DSM 15933]
MSRRPVFWRGLLLAWTILLWLVVAAVLAVAASLPTSYEWSNDEIPPIAILQNALRVVAPAVLTAAFAQTAATVALSVARTKRPAPVPAEEDDPWQQDAVLLTR